MKTVLCLTTFSIQAFFGQQQVVATDDGQIHLRRHQRHHRLLQEPGNDISNLDPFDFYDGISSMTYSPGNRTTRTFGYFDYLNDIPMTSDAVIPIGSNSKLFTAVAIYQLQERGLLNVTADIATMLDKTDFEKFGLYGIDSFCPQLGYNGPGRPCEVITLQNLLSMSSGFYPTLNCDEIETEPGLCDNLPYFLGPYFDGPGSTGEFVGTFILNPLIYKLGERFQYANPNFILAQYFIEKYSGLSFQQYLQENIFEPAGLENTFFDYFNGALTIQPRRTHQYYRYYNNTSPYDLISTGSVFNDLNLGSVGGTGGLLSTTGDIVTFYHTLFNKTTGGAPLLSDPTSQEAILGPIAAMGNSPIPGGASLGSFFTYFAQGVIVACTMEKCPNGPDHIRYNGGTLTVQTANVMQYNTPDMVMSQVWTTSKVMLMSQEEFDSQLQSQTGSLELWTDDFTVKGWNPLIMAFGQLLSLPIVAQIPAPPTRAGDGQGNGKESASSDNKNIMEGTTSDESLSSKTEDNLEEKTSDSTSSASTWMGLGWMTMTASVMSLFGPLL